MPPTQFIIMDPKSWTQKQEEIIIIIMKERNSYSPEFKAKIILELLRRKRPLVRLAVKPGFIVRC